MPQLTPLTIVSCLSRYGHVVSRTGRAKAGVCPRWEGAPAKAHSAHELCLTIRELDTTGSVHVTLWAEHELHDAELGRIEVRGKEKAEGGCI